MGIGGGKIVIAGPHREIGQRELTDRHHSIFPIIQLVHGSLMSCQILQCSQEVTLFVRIALLLLTLLAALAVEVS